MDDSSTSQSMQTPERTETVTITDMAGRNVEVPVNVERIVAVGAGALRQIAYLESMDKVVGVESNEKDDATTIHAVYKLVHLDKMAGLSEVGPAHGGNAELIAGADPQVVFFSGTSGDVSDAEGYQTKTGIPVVFIDVGDMAGEDRKTTYQCWQICGEVLGKTERATELQEYTEQLIADLNARTEDIPDEEKPIAFPGALSHRGGQGILSTQYPFATLEFINARHALDEGGIAQEEIKTHAFSVGQENLFSWDPEVIFIDLSNLGLVSNDVERSPSYKDLKAFKEDNVHGFLPVSSYHRNYESVFVNSYYMGSVLYPERFDDIDIDEKADEIYGMFLGEPAYDKVKNELGGGARKLSF
ncbi:ABC transporter substrate-binding protein [Methanolobus sp. WCC5]|uniref:ABC transporter substrate-binding protein n=1 Tax=Methanolobus sp. WCC5 TaxID=3125785 RepID=UPI003251161E